MLLKVAGIVVRTWGECSYVRQLCAGYQADGEDADIEVCLDPAMPPEEQSIDLLRKINDALILRDTFLMHCSALAYEGEAYLFAAPSGTGKSTHARMWRRAFGDKVTMINDDKPFISVEGDRIFACGSPWCGKHALGTDIKVPIRAICFISRAETDSIRPISADEALSFIFDQVARSYHPAYMDRLLSLLDAVLANTALYSLKCTPTVNAAYTALTCMKGVLQ